MYIDSSKLNKKVYAYISNMIFIFNTLHIYNLTVLNFSFYHLTIWTRTTVLDSVVTKFNISIRQSNFETKLRSLIYITGVNFSNYYHYWMILLECNKFTIDTVLIRFDTPKNHARGTCHTEIYGMVWIPKYVIHEILFGSMLNSYKF